MSGRGGRQDRIMAHLARDGAVSSAAMARQLGVNIATIRRDLEAMEASGLLQRTHGGAVASRLGRIEFAFHEQQLRHAVEKRAIARSAAKRVESGMTLSLDTGSSTLEVARQIRNVPGLRVLTCSLAVAAVLYPAQTIELVLLGGTARKGSPDLFGMLTESNIRRFRVDMAILGADAATRDGLYTTDTRIAAVSRALLDGAKRSVLVADHTKFDASAFVRFCEWDAIDAVITDDGVRPDTRDWLDRIASKVIYCNPNESLEA